MIYRGRPVFQFEVNWAPDMSRTFTLDLRQVGLGFGAEFFTSRQQYVNNGWAMRVELTSATDIEAFDAFTEALSGRLQGFWLPVPPEALAVVAAVSATQFDIADQGLTESWSDTPDQHLYFTARGVTAQAAKITNVVDNGDGTERVTLDGGMSPAIDTTFSVSRLHYVRLSEDVESSSVVMENFLSRQVTVIELPQEYAAAESGDAPIYLYHIFARAPIDYHWRYTSFASDIWSDNKLHTAAAITHGKLVRSVELTVQTVEVTTAYGTRNPFSLMLPFPTGRPMSIEIRQATAADPDTATLLFAGTVRQVNDAGTHLVAQCDNFFSTFKKRIPPMLIKPQCDYQLFEPRTCKAVEALYTAEGFITAIDNTAQPPTVELSLRFPLFPTGQKLVADHFAQGWFTTGIELNYEARTIFSSMWNTGTQRMLIETNGPLVNAIVGQEILLRPGCDGEATTCVSKFDNFIHYPGFQFVPANNPSLQAIESKASQGNKK